MASKSRSIPILKTKLHRPAVAGDIVDRPFLYDRLDEGRNLPLTLVSAPAGYGKSSLISGWMNQKGYPYAWLTLETSESDLRSFLTYLSASIQTLFSSALSDLDGLLNQDPLPDDAILLTSLSNALVELESDFILVLDDFHQLNSMEASTFIDNLLEHPPRRMHVVLITRRDPALKMRSLRLHRRMNEFRSRELRLAREEAKEFLERVSQQELAADTVTRIFSATEGWPVGLRLSALAIRYADEGPVMEGFSGDTLATQEYLVGEILSKLRPEMRECVESLAILNRFCAGVCEAMFEHDRETVTDSGADLTVLN